MLRTARGARRHPPRREDAAPARAGRRRPRGDPRVLRGDVGAKPLPPLPRGSPRSTTALVDRFVDVDWNETGCVVGESRARIVACASWARLREPRAAEVAFAVADEMQGLGVGTRLLEQLAALAARPGSSASWRRCCPRTGDAAASSPTRGSRPRASCPAARSRCGSTSRTTEHYQARVDERDHVAVACVAAAVLRAEDGRRHRRLARAAKTIGGELFRNVLRAEFAGAAYPVNVGAKPVAGVPRVRDGGRHPAAGRPRRDLRPRRGRDRRGAVGAGSRGARALRHLGRLRGDGRRGRSPPGGAARDGRARTARA